MKSTFTFKSYEIIHLYNTAPWTLQLFPASHHKVCIIHSLRLHGFGTDCQQKRWLHTANICSELPFSPGGQRLGIFTEGKTDTAAATHPCQTEFLLFLTTQRTERHTLTFDRSSYFCHLPFSAPKLSVASHSYLGLHNIPMTILASANVQNMWLWLVLAYWLQCSIGEKAIYKPEHGTWKTEPKKWTYSKEKICKDLTV